MLEDQRGLEEELKPKKEGITVTDAAKEKIASMCVENNMEAVRPYVYGGGCGGMQHSMTFAEQKEDRDLEIAPHVFVDPIAYQFMVGSTIDYETSGLGPSIWM